MKVVFPGSFDPLTFGHLSIIERASALFEEVHIAVAAQPSTVKQTRWSIQQRLQMVEAAVGHIDRVKVHQFSGLLVTFLKQLGVATILRGVRSAKDWEFETELYQVHKILWPEVEMICLAADSRFTTVSSSFVREILHYHGDISKLVPSEVYRLIKET